MRRGVVLLAALLTCVAGSAGAARAVEGEERLLVALVTWGPEPFPRTHADTVLAETASFMSSASFGRVRLVGDTTPWLHALERRPTQCDPLGLMQTADSALERAGFAIADYTRVAYAFPRFEACSWGGAYWRAQIQLNGRMDRHVLAHELGHIYGVPEEGPAWVCAGGRCAHENYESPYSVMGHGLGDFSAYEKRAYGWIDSIVRPVATGAYAIGAIDRPGADPYALHVLVAGDEYWLEYRPPDPRWHPDEPTAVPGLAVYGGPNGVDWAESTFPVRNLLIRNPVVRGRSAVGVGQRFRVPGAFEVTLTAMGADRAETSFRWLDRKAPAAVRIFEPRPSRAGASAVVRWEPPRDRGAGIGFYEVRIDGALPRVVPAAREVAKQLVAVRPQLALGRLSPGSHRVAIVAVDRAGNRGATARRQFVVRA